MLGRRGSRDASSVRAGRRLKKSQDRVLGAAVDFDRVDERKFPAFRGQHLRDVLLTRAGGHALVSALPESSDEFVTHGEVLSLCEPQRGGALRRRRL